MVDCLSVGRGGAVPEASRNATNNRSLAEYILVAPPWVRRSDSNIPRNPRDGERLSDKEFNSFIYTEFKTL